MELKTERQFNSISFWSIVKFTLLGYFNPQILKEKGAKGRTKTIFVLIGLAVLWGLILYLTYIWTSNGLAALIWSMIVLTSIICPLIFSYVSIHESIFSKKNYDQTITWPITWPKYVFAKTFTCLVAVIVCTYFFIIIPTVTLVITPNEFYYTSQIQSIGIIPPDRTAISNTFLLLMPFITVPLFAMIGGGICLLANSIGALTFHKKIVSGLIHAFFIILFCAIFECSLSLLDEAIHPGNWFYDLCSAIRNYLLHFPLSWEQCITTFGIGIGLYLIYNLCVAKWFTRIYAHVVTEKYKTTEYKYIDKYSSRTWTLFKMHNKRLFSSGAYSVNSLFGPLIHLVIIVSLSVTIILQRKFLSEEGFVNMINDGIKNQTMLWIVLLLFIGIITIGSLISSPIATTLNMEGRCFWITSTAPISKKQFIISRYLLHIFYVAIPNLIGNIVLCVIMSSIMKINFAYFLIAIFLSLFIVLVHGLFGLSFNMWKRKYEWEKITQGCKNCMANLIYCLIGVAIVILLFIVLGNVSGALMDSIDADSGTVINNPLMVGIMISSLIGIPVIELAITIFLFVKHSWHFN